MSEGTPQPSFSREQKIGFVLLLVFALFTLGIGVLQIRNTVYGPFVIHKTDNATVVASDAIRLQQIDTDHDGLNDYEEENLYGTSRYLPDTDSDGIGDKEEVLAGTDPLCPEGTACQNNDNLSTTTAPIFGVPGVGDGNLVNSVAGTNTSTTSAADLQNIVRDPVALRQLLLSSGSISEADLNAISDTELVQFAEQIFRQQAMNLTSSTR